MRLQIFRSRARNWLLAVQINIRPRINAKVANRKKERTDSCVFAFIRGLISSDRRLLLAVQTGANQIRSGLVLNRGPWLPAIALLAILLAAGCRSRVIQVSVINTSAQPISTIIVDYPDATFGVNVLAPGKTFQYVIKPTGTGPVKVQFTDTAGANHAVTGPTVRKGAEGTMRIKLTQDSGAFE
jgi:hypothetical protein